MGLSSLKPMLDARGVRLIGIAGEYIGHEEFTRDFWKGELFFDLEKKTWFPAMAGKNKPPTNTLGGLWHLMTSSAFKRVKGIKYNMDGDKGLSLILGGVWIVHPREGVVFEYPEKMWGDNVCVNKMEELQAAINGLKGESRSFVLAPPRSPC